MENSKALTWQYLFKSNLALSLTLCFVVLSYILMIVYYPYYPIDDEVQQIEAAVNIFNGYSYTTTHLQNDLSVFSRDWLRSWPAGYSYTLNALMKMPLSLSTATKLVKISIFILGIYAWSNFAIKWFKDKKPAFAFISILIYTYIYFSSYATDMFICSLFPFLVNNMMIYYDNSKTMNSIKNAYVLIISGIIVSLCILTKYTAIPMLVVGCFFIIFVRFRSSVYCVRDLSIYSVLPLSSLTGIMLSNYMNSSKHALTHADTDINDFINISNEVLLLAKHFIISLETLLTSIFMIGRASFFLNDHLQPIFYHLSAIILLAIIVKASIYVYKYISKALIIWTLIACLTNILFLTCVTVILAHHYGPFAETITGISRYHWYYVPGLYLIMVLWLNGTFCDTCNRNYFYNLTIIISIVGFVCVSNDKLKKFAHSKALYTDAVNYISNIKSKYKTNAITVIGDFSYIRLIRGVFDVNLDPIESSKLISELNSGKYFSSPTMLILLYEKSNIDTRLDNSLILSGFSKTVAKSTVIYHRLFEPGLLHLVQ